MKRVLVTGGCGFIGSHLVDALLARGDKVVVLDDLSTGKRGNIPQRCENLSFVQGCITDSKVVAEVVSGVNQIVHLAAVSSVHSSVENPKWTHAVNFDGMLNLLDAASLYGVKRVVFASSAAVYGNPNSLPIGEDVSPAPLTPYAIDKLSCERYLSFYQQHFDLDTLTFRFFNVYGPRQDASSPYSGVISLFIDAILKKSTITIFGDGKQTRDFIHVGDVVKALLWGLNQEKGGGEMFNLGSGEQTSLLELIRILQEFSDTEIEIQYENARQGDVRHSLADMTKLRALLRNEVATPFASGIRMLVEETGAI